ncbi:MAG TPA: DUF308 domain-containing protein [Polyangia bacterium]|nr:DUF308 domain-containing protein [Polyangia bacterium]
MLGLKREELGLASQWRWVILRGVVAIVFGLLAFARPLLMSLSLFLWFAAYAFIEGVATLISAARDTQASSFRRGTLVVEGLLGVAVGVVAVLWPASAAVALIWVIGAWAIVAGALEIMSAIRLRRIIEHEWMLGLAGALTIALGLVLLYRPLLGGLAIMWWLGGYAIVFGALMIGLGLRLRRHAYEHAHGENLPMGGGLHQPS